MVCEPSAEVCDETAVYCLPAKTILFILVTRM